MLEGQNRNQLSVFKCKMRTKNSCNNKEIEKRLTQYLLNSGAEALIWTWGDQQAPVRVTRQGRPCSYAIFFALYLHGSDVVVLLSKWRGGKFETFGNDAVLVDDVIIPVTLPAD